MSQTTEEILANLNANAIATVAELTTAINTAIAAMNALKDKASIQTDKTDEIFAATPADVTLPSGDIVPNFAKVRDDLTAAITAFTSVAYLEANAQAVDSAKLDGKTLSTIASDIKTEIIGAAPALLDTLEEIAAALGDDDTAINSLLAQLSTLSTSLTALSDAVADKAPTVHEHDSRYYTKSQIDTAIGDATSKPTFTTDAVTNIAGGYVTLNGTISDFGDASSSLQYRFIYGPTTDMEEGATTWTAVSSIGAVSASVTVNLLTTTYYVLMQIRDTNKPDSMGILPISADWAAERTSFLSGSEILDSDSYIYLQETGGTGYSTLNGTTVPNITNGSIVNNKVVFSANGNATTKSFDQEALQNDFRAITPTTKIKANKLTVDSTSTYSVPVFTSGYDNLLSTGSKIIVDDGGTIKEVTAGTVTKTGSSPTYKYTLASTTPTLTNNPSSAYVGGQQTYIYSADNFAGKTLTVDASTTHQTMTVKSGSTAAIPIFVGTTSGLITIGQHILVEDGTWKDVVAGTVTMVNPSAGVYEYTIAGTTPALNSTPTSAKATGKLVLTTDTTGVITSGDTVSLNSGTGGTNQNVVFGSVVESNSTVSTVNIFGDNSCIALYQFEGNANDTSGIYNGIATNVTYGTGKFGQCAVFNGSSSYIATSSGNLGIGAKTISLWVKSPDFSKYSQLISDSYAGIGGNSGTTGTGLGVDNRKIIFRSKEYAIDDLIFNVETNTTFNNNIWYHIVASWDGTTSSNGVKIYVNGVLDVSGTALKTQTSTPTHNITFGKPADYSNYYFSGSLDQIRIYNRALSASEVTTLYNEIVMYYTCTLPTPALVQVPTTANKGELVVPTLTGFTKATDTISYVYTKTALPANSRSLAVRVDGTIADAVTSLEGVIYV